MPNARMPQLVGAARVSTSFAEARRKTGLLLKPLDGSGAISPRVHKRPLYSADDFRLANRELCIRRKWRYWGPRSET